MSFPRVTCPHCGRDVPQRKNGAPFLHTASSGAHRCDGSVFMGGQAPIPFRAGLAPARLRPPSTLPPGTCPKCGCHPDARRCVVQLPDGHGESACVPAGMFGRKVCSACLVVMAACLLALSSACGGAPFTEAPAAVDVDAGELAADVYSPVDGRAAADAGGQAFDAPAADAGAGLEAETESHADARADALERDAGAELDAAADVLEHDAPPVDAPPSCSAPACPACTTPSMPCCRSNGACGCVFGGLGACN